MLHTAALYVRDTSSQQHHWMWQILHYFILLFLCIFQIFGHFDALAKLFLKLSANKAFELNWLSLSPCLSFSLSLSFSPSLPFSHTSQWWIGSALSLVAPTQKSAAVQPDKKECVRACVLFSALIISALLRLRCVSPWLCVYLHALFTYCQNDVIMLFYVFLNRSPKSYSVGTSV